MKTRRFFYNEQDKRDIDRLVGHNLMVARHLAGFSQSEVMRALWGVSDNRNRISEIENGSKSISIHQLLIFCKCYGVSADYLLGLSCEPINDIYASHINNIMLNSKHYLEPMIQALVQNAVEHIAKIDKDHHVELIETAERVGQQIAKNCENLHGIDPVLHQLLNQLYFVVKRIKTKEAAVKTQLYAQIEAIQERHDKNEHHMLLDDVERRRIYTYALPEPRVVYQDRG